MFSAVLFSRLRVYGENTRFRSQFRGAFPSVHKMLQEIKQRDETTLPGLTSIIRPENHKFKFSGSSKAYKNVSCALQRAESAMMFQVIAPKLVAAGIKFITVQDSWMMLPSDVEQARDIIEQCFLSVKIPMPSLLES